ncbi:MAG: hypothetical protein ACRC0X_01965, partial [Brevinema sp.]
MKYLLILLLIISGCAEKKAQAVEEPILEPVKVDPITNIVETIEVSYDKGLDLILVDTGGGNNISSHFLSRKDKNYREYQAIYWDQKNHINYHAAIELYTNHLLYTLDSNLQYEPVIIKEYQEFVFTDTPLLYIGS